jgi:phosphatidate cytidylyltransferase
MNSTLKVGVDVLIHRLITGLTAILLIIGVLWLDAWMGPVMIGEWSLPTGLLLAILGCLMVSLGARELCVIAAASGIRTSPGFNAIACVLVMLATWLTASNLPADLATALPLTVLAITLIGSLLWFSRGQEVQGVFASTAVVMLSTIYLGMLSGFLLLVGAESSVWMIGVVALVVKSCDIGAFFTGTAIGRHKLIPWLSPGKTVEGLLGGIAASMLAAFILNIIWDSPIDWWWALTMGAMLAIVGQAGDLTMSLFKRGAGVKDSSALLPGLGGVMDVVDSLLLTAPLAWWLIRMTPGTGCS